MPGRIADGKTVGATTLGITIILSHVRTLQIPAGGQPDPLGLGQRAALASRSRWTPPLNPRTRTPLGPQDLAAHLPDGADPAGILAPAGDRYSRRSDGHLPAVARHAAVPRAAPGEGARYAGPHLLQVRRHQPGGQPQAQHRRGAGVLQQARGHQAAWPPKPARGSGAARWRWPASCSAWSARSTWCA